MKVFLSWSGDRSQALALAMRDWLKLVLHFVEPWVSKSDIEAGERWATEIAKELEASNFGIIALTRENLESPWILFEAGALARSMEEGRVIPLLLDVEFKDVTGPLAQFQAKKVERGGISEIVGAINRFSGNQIPDARLEQLVELAWPKLEEAVNNIPKTTLPAKHNRPQAEVLEELVSSVRGLEVRYREGIDDGPRFRGRRRFHPAMVEELLHFSRTKPGDPVRILMMASFFREELPWIYELGMEVYRAALSGDQEATSYSAHKFIEMLREIRHTPLLDMIGSKDTHFLMREVSHIMEEEMHNVRPKRASAKKRPLRASERAIAPSADKEPKSS